MIILYGSGQSRSIRVLWALEEAGLEYEYRQLKFGDSEQDGSASDAYRVLNSQGKVPTLIDTSHEPDLIITESAAALNYIASLNPQANLIPKTLVQRVHYDELCFFVLSDLEQPLWTAGKHRFALPKAKRVSAILPTTHYEFEKSIKALDVLVNDSEYALGENFSMVDILIAQTINWAQRFKFYVPKKWLSYKDKMYARSACIKAFEMLKQVEGKTK